MKYKILASASSGNATVIYNDRQTIGIDFGISYKKYKSLLGSDIPFPSFIFITHTHGDHFNESGMRAMLKQHDPVIYNNGNTVDTGEFTVQGFRVPHDVICYGFKITENATGESMVFITDDTDEMGTAKRFKELLTNADYYLLEGNFDEWYLENTDVAEAYGYNIASGFYRHSSKQDALKAYAMLRGPKTKELQFLHKSGRFFDK